MDEIYPGFNKQVHAWLEDWHMPGLALAVVRAGEADWLQGFGYRDIERGLPVTPLTIFPLASASKAFTALAVGQLVDAERLDWDIPLGQLLPGFRLHDPQASQSVTVRDLLCHRSGLPGHDLTVYHADFSRLELLHRLPHLELNQPLRAAFQYNNHGYIALGCLVGQLQYGDLENGWDAWVAERIFQPLDMRRAGFAFPPPGEADFARPYRWVAGAFHELPIQPGAHLIGPAGGVMACAADMARWLAAHLKIPSSAQLVSPAVMAELHSPQIAVAEGEGLQALASYPEIEDLSYALGWYTWNYRGQRMLFHGGEMDGIKTLVSFLPASGVGMAVLLNAHLSSLGWLLTLWLYDRLCGFAQVDWEARLAPRFNPPGIPGGEGLPVATAPEEALAPPLDEYVGRYQHPGYGVVTIEQQLGGLDFHIHDLEFEITRRGADEFYLYYALYDFGLPVNFLREASGRVKAFSAPFEPSVAPLIFDRIS